MNVCLLPYITRKKGGITSGENTGRNTFSILVIPIQKSRLSIRRDSRAVQLMLTGIEGNEKKDMFVLCRNKEKKTTGAHFRGAGTL